MNLDSGFIHFSLENDLERERQLEILRAIQDLKAMNDSQLQNLGLTRDSIENAVRFGLFD
ncbi:hypothetical protein [Thiolinea disciformis]|uniref:hypothetical protein n=1 Tax=Thiolinea disciformis TaxID=125614 RepID=UPI00037A5D9E|nr:hypothetical protein [Thiolinea disciformis]